MQESSKSQSELLLVLKRESRSSKCFSEISEHRERMRNAVRLWDALSMQKSGKFCDSALNYYFLAHVRARYIYNL